MIIPDVKDCIKGEVEFQYCRSNELWYKSENGFLFPVPISDIGDATFLAKDRAMLFMRYMRKHIAALKESDV